MSKRRALHVAAMAVFIVVNLLIARGADAKGTLDASSYIEASDAEVEAIFAEARERGEVVVCVSAITPSGCRDELTVNTDGLK